MNYSYKSLLDTFDGRFEEEYKKLYDHLKSLENYIDREKLDTVYTQNLFTDSDDVIYAFLEDKIIKLITEPVGDKERLIYQSYKLKDIVNLVITEQPKYTYEIELKIIFKEETIILNSSLDTNQHHQRGYYDLIKQISKEILEPA